jgi:hypothetical protein
LPQTDAAAILLVGWGTAAGAYPAPGAGVPGPPEKITGHGIGYVRGSGAMNSNSATSDLNGTTGNTVPIPSGAMLAINDAGLLRRLTIAANSAVQQARGRETAQAHVVFPLVYA